MGQINLLKQQEDHFAGFRLLSGILVKILLIVLIGAVAYYGWLYFSLQKTEKQILSTESQIQARQQVGFDFKSRQEVLTRQVQLQEFAKILNQHVYFSKIFGALAKVTLKTAAYTNFKATADGEVNLSVVVPNIMELDKFLQVFDAPQFNESFSSVKISSWSKIRFEEGMAYKFDLQMKYNPSIIKFQQAK